jgi:hypothetical protein
MKSQQIEVSCCELQGNVFVRMLLRLSNSDGECLQQIGASWSGRGTQFGDDLPPVSLSLPQQFQSTAEWEVLYLDETLRVNRGQQGELFIFTRKT